MALAAAWTPRGEAAVLHTLICMHLNPGAVFLHLPSWAVVFSSQIV